MNSRDDTARVELQDNPYLSALNGYIAELGARLELTAVFPDQRISLIVPSGELEDNLRALGRHVTSDTLEQIRARLGLAPGVKQSR